MATTTPQNISTRGFGASDTLTLNTLFPKSGRFDLSNYNVEVETLKLVDGVINGNIDIPSFSLDWDDAPDLDTFHPNPASPGPSLLDSDKPDTSHIQFPRSGMGSLDEPKDSSVKISHQNFSNIKLGTSEV